MRRALVTGGVGGIGAAIVKRLRADGHDPIALDVSVQRVAEFRSAAALPAYVCDVADVSRVADAITEIERLHGPIDILVNAAGITRDAMVHKMSARDQWQVVIDVNLTSVFNTVRCLAPGMRERGWGRIVNISSMNGERGQVGQSNYAAAKAGMIGFTKSIALEMAAKGVTANCVAPGFINTDMTRAMRPEIFAQEVARIPVGRTGEVDDIAAAVSFLARDEAGFITGQVMSVNGGQYM